MPRRDSPRFRRAAFALVLSLAPGGCVRVDPAPDYRRTAELIGERTGHGEVHDPLGDPAAENARVDALLAAPLTIDAAVGVALLNNPRLQAILRDVGISRANLVQAGLLSNPTLFASTRFPETSGKTNVTLSVTQSLAELILMPIRKGIARAQLEASRVAAANAAVDLVAAVKRGAYELLALQRLERIVGDDLALAGRSVETARRRFDAGEGSVLDVDLARGAALELRRELVTVQRDRRLAAARLAERLGVARRPGQVAIAGELPGPRALGDPDRLLAAALRERLDVRIADLRVAMAAGELSRERAGVFSQVAAGFERERAESPPNLSGPTVDVTVPLWHQNQALIARARMLLERRRRERDAVLDAAAGQVRRALARARAGAELVRLHEEEILPLARRNVERAGRGYTAGEQEILTLIDAQRSLIARRRAHARALEEYALSLAELERALGGRLPAPRSPREGAGGSGEEQGG